MILNYIETDEIHDYLSLKIYYTKNLKTNTKCSENFSSVYLKSIIWNMKLEIKETEDEIWGWNIGDRI